MKRKVTFVISRGGDHPDAKDCIYRQAELNVSEGWETLRPIAVAVETSGPTLNADGEDTYDNVGTVIGYDDIRHLVGEMLTYIDATFSDPEQRKAHKDIVSNTVYKWYGHHTREAEKTIEFARGFDNPILK